MVTAAWALPATIKKLVTVWRMYIPGARRKLGRPPIHPARLRTTVSSTQPSVRIRVVAQPMAIRMAGSVMFFIPAMYSLAMRLGPKPAARPERTAMYRKTTETRSSPHLYFRQPEISQTKQPRTTRRTRTFRRSICWNSSRGLASTTPAPEYPYMVLLVGSALTLLAYRTR